MTIDFLEGDVREVLKTLPNDHFDCVVTSPPVLGSPRLWRRRSDRP